VQVFICPSRFLVAKVTQGGVYPDRLEQLSSFVVTREVAPKAQPGGGVVYAGRLSHEKGVDVLVEAVARLGHGHLEVVGDGPQRTGVAAGAAARAAGRVRFHGRVPRERVLDLLRSGAVAVMPSRCHDNQPMAVLEAFGCGVPVLATNLGGLPELVDGGYGEVVPPENPDAMAAALGRLLAQPERTWAMGRAARSRAEREFAPDRHLAGLERLYQRARSDRAA
jgi:glycosyltransferase involved in cell wall biosynthesis